MLRGYRELKVWQRSMDLVDESYRLTSTFPKHELYGLTSQFRRAAVSVAANIREHLGEYLHSLSIANGSLMELETHLLIGRRMNYVPAEEEQGFLQRAAEVGRMLAGLVRAPKDVHTDTRHLAPGTYSVRNATIGSTRVARRAGR